jgi:hypothetical protein
VNFALGSGELPPPTNPSTFEKRKRREKLINKFFLFAIYVIDPSGEFLSEGSASKVGLGMSDSRESG